MTPAEKHEGHAPSASPSALSSPGGNLTTDLLFMQLNAIQRPLAHCRRGRKASGPTATRFTRYVWSRTSGGRPALHSGSLPGSTSRGEARGSAGSRVQPARPWKHSRSILSWEVACLWGNGVQGFPTRSAFSPSFSETGSVREKN